MYIKLSEDRVDSNNYREREKQNMEHALEIVKEVLSQEIEARFHSAQL